MDDLILPGERVGQIQFGMTMDEVIAAVGQPDRIERRSAHVGAPTYPVFDYSSQHALAVLFTPIPEVLVWTVETTNPAFRTRGGNGVGSPEPSVASEWGDPEVLYDGPTARILCYTSFGLQFNMSTDRLVMLLRVISGVWGSVPGQPGQTWVPALLPINRSG